MNRWSWSVRASKRSLNLFLRKSPNLCIILWIAYDWTIYYSYNEVITFPLSRDNPLLILKNCRVFYISFVMFHTLMLSTLIAVCNILWEFVFNVNTLSDSRRVSTWRGFLNIGEYQVEEHRIFTLRAAVHFRTCQTSRFLLSIFSSYTFLSFTLASFTSTCLFVNLFSGLLTEIKFSWDWF